MLTESLYIDWNNSFEVLDKAYESNLFVLIIGPKGTGKTTLVREFATINPLSHVGTKELPPQLLSRFPVRIKLDYPPEEIELKIVKNYVSVSHEKEILRGIKLANILRQAAAVEELYYSPSLRETIAFGKVLDSGMKPRQAADVVFANIYAQWGSVEYQKVNDIITSMFGN